MGRGPERKRGGSDRGLNEEVEGIKEGGPRWRERGRWLLALCKMAIVCSDTKRPQKTFAFFQLFVPLG